ncbi:BPSS1780 family membrane protein [Porticoccus sp. GXU_MW_L64]
MTEDNPYQAPQADVVEPQQPGERSLVAPRACSVGSGWHWIKEAFSLFARSPGIWILLCLVLFGMSVVISFVPLGSVALSLFTYVLVAGMMMGCADLEGGSELSVEHLFRGFKHESMSALVICGAVVLVLGMVATIPLGLGWLVLAPIMVLTMYSSYKAIFTEASQELSS